MVGPGGTIPAHLAASAARPASVTVDSSRRHRAQHRAKVGPYASSIKCLTRSPDTQNFGMPPNSTIATLRSSGRRRRRRAAHRTQRRQAALGDNQWRLGHGRRRLELQTTTTARGFALGLRSVAAMANHGNGEVKEIHSNDSSKTLLKTDALYEYMLDTTVYPWEPECLRELRLITKQHPVGYMSSQPDEAQLLSVLLKMTGAKHTVEVGVFTGYSLLATALALPDDGKVVAIDVNRKYYDLGAPVIEKAGVNHKIDFREGPAMPILDEMLADEGNTGKFDFAFVDADKSNYGNYHERLMQLVRVGGVVAYDNTLWGGSVALPEDTPLTEHDREVRGFMKAFNARIAADRRVEACQLPVADGITLCRRVA